MKTIKITDEAWARLYNKKIDLGAKTLSDAILIIISSQEDLQKSFWSIIKGEKSAEQWRKDLHYENNKS